MKAPLRRRLEALEATAPTAAASRSPPTLYVRFVACADRDTPKLLAADWQSEQLKQEPTEEETGFMDRLRSAVNRSLPAPRRNALVLVHEVPMTGKARPDN